MLIIGAKGFAKEVLEVLHQKNKITSLAFYDDVNEDIGDLLYEKYRILHNIEEAKVYFKEVSSKFTIGIGDPLLRRKMYDKFKQLGGEFTTTISPIASIGSYDNTIENGCNIMASVVLTNSIKIGMGTIINQISSIGHDVVIGDFCEICPNVSISGNCKLGENVFVGTGAIILPNIKIGDNVVIGAGAVVSKDLPNNCVAVGIPAKIIKQN